MPSDLQGQDQVPDLRIIQEKLSAEYSKLQECEKLLAVKIILQLNKLEKLLKKL